MISNSLQKLTGDYENLYEGKPEDGESPFEAGKKALNTAEMIRNSSLLVNFNPRWSYICEKLSDDDFIGRQDTSYV